MRIPSIHRPRRPHKLPTRIVVVPDTEIQLLAPVQATILDHHAQEAHLVLGGEGMGGVIDVVGDVVDVEGGAVGAVHAVHADADLAAGVARVFCG